MMNLKRLGALSLSVVLALSALSGCKSGNDEGQSSSSSQTDASSSSVTQVEPMDLTGVTDPYLAAAGLAGDTVVATAGGAEITADSLLYWLTYGIDGSAQYYSMFGMGEMPWDTEVDGKTLEDALMDSALQTAALYALLPGLAEQEGAAASPDVDQRAEEALASMAKDSGGEEMLDHALWGSALTRDLFKQMMRVNDMNGQLQDKLYGEGTAGYPSDAQVLSYAQDEKGVYRAKHILLKTVDTDKPITDEDGNPTGEYEALDDAVVATDDERIRDAVRAFGGRVEMTSPDHRSGTDRCWEAYCKQGREYDVVVNVQGDEPFIRPSQLEAVKRCFDDPATDIATLVKPFTEADGLAALENPNSPKVVLDAQSRAIYFSRSVIPYLRGVPREERLARHTFYKHIGLYAFRADVLRAVTALPQSPLELAESLEQLRWLENGYKIGVGISEVETIGIDTPEDLEKAERFLQLKIKNEE